MDKTFPHPVALYIFDNASDSWVPYTGGSGGSSVFLGKFHGDPVVYTEGDLWYDLDLHVYKGYNGTNIVLL